MGGVVAVMRRLVVAVVAGIVIGGAAFSQENTPKLEDPGMIAAGHDLFLAKQCAHCHGTENSGDGENGQRYGIGHW